jgi:hypothetical protein
MGHSKRTNLRLLRHCCSVEADHYFAQLLLPGDRKLLGSLCIALVESRLDSAQDVVEVFQILRGQLVLCACGLRSLFHMKKIATGSSGRQQKSQIKGGRARHPAGDAHRAAVVGLAVGGPAPPDPDHSRVFTAFPTSRPRVMHFSRSSAEGAHKAFTPLLTSAIPLSSRRFSMMPMDSPLQP